MAEFARRHLVRSRRLPERATRRGRAELEIPRGGHRALETALDGQSSVEIVIFRSGAVHETPEPIPPTSKTIGARPDNLKPNNLT
jgi:hypothetical protein